MRVAIIEDHPLFRDSLRLLLTSAGMTVVAEAGDVAGSRTVWATRPDIVVVDLALPDGSGEQVVADAAAHCPAVRIMVLSMATDATSVTRAFAAGAHGYLVKDASADEVVTAINAVAAGSMVMGGRVAPRLHGSDAIAALAPSERDFPGLTARERQVLGLVADGQSNAQIADALAVSGKTVANYVSALLSSLYARDRTHLADLVNARRPRPTRAHPATGDARAGETPPSTWRTQ